MSMNLTTKMPSYRKELRIAKQLAKKAGKIMLKYYEADQGVQVKIDNSLVTIADEAINKMVITALSRSFPKDGVVGEEESNTEYGMGRKWFCDPIDGTAGYVWGVPTAMFSLALVIDGVPTVGVTYDPFQKRMYHAIKGQGAYCNGKKIQVSNTMIKDKGIFAVTGNVLAISQLPYVAEIRAHGGRLATFSGLVHKACLVARGRFVGFIEYGANAYDLAAIEVIVEEAGGKVTDFQGNKYDYTVPHKMNVFISNSANYEHMLKTYNVDVPNARSV